MYRIKTYGAQHVDKQNIYDICVKNIWQLMRNHPKMRIRDVRSIHGREANNRFGVNSGILQKFIGFGESFILRLTMNFISTTKTHQSKLPRGLLLSLF